MRGLIVKHAWKAICAVILGLGLYAVVVRFTQGLGASTNLSDEFPWGLWIGFDVLVGVGLAAGGFVVAASVHIFRITRYEEITRPTILTAFLGYVLVIVALMFDLGRPYRIWHPLVMGNPHSVMFEVAMCVMLYTTVLALEFSPLVFAKLKMRAPQRVIQAIYTPLVIVGVLLSTLHQSSLGTLYVIVPDKLYPLWYSPLLPLFFFLSAVAGGLAMVIFESFMSARAFGKRLEQDLLEGLARVIVVVLAVLFVWRMTDLHGRGSFGLMFEPTGESVMLWGELLLGVALPMVMFMIPRVRRSQGGLFFGALLTIMGFILYRLNVAITGIARSSGVNYIPSWMEFAITAAIVALGFILFGVAAKHLDVFPAEAAPKPSPFPSHPTTVPTPRYAGRGLLALWGILLLGFLVFGFTTRRNNSHADAAATASGVVSGSFTPATAVPALRDDMKLATGEDSPGVVLFNHSSHVDGVNPTCVPCHAGTFRITPEGARKFKGEDFHGAEACGRCHDGKTSFNIDDDCEACHTP